MKALAQARVLVVGAGGLGSPCAVALARAGVGTLGLVDDDEVELSNLHRQIFFSESDVGRKKIDALARAIEGTRMATRVEQHHSRLLPHNATDLISRYDLVVEGSDNFATKFLAADACFLANKPVVHGSAVRWIGTAFAIGSGGAPCYRCVFEDVPKGNAPNCAEAGVLGPCVGVIAALQVDLALSTLRGEPVAGTLISFDGRSEELKRRQFLAQPHCPLCGGSAEIKNLDAKRYLSPAQCAL